MLISHEFDAGQKIVVEGDPGDLLYIIKSGNVICSVKGIQIRKLGVGKFFGEQALLYKTKRTATVTALNHVTALSLKSEDLVKVLGSQLQHIIYKNSQKIAIEKSSILKSLTKDQIDACADTMKVKSYEEGGIVVKTHRKKNSRIFFVLKGSIKSETGIVELFGCIGDEYILENNEEAYGEKWTASCDTDIAIISKEKLYQCLNGDLEQIINTNEILRILKRVQIFRNLPKKKLENIISMMQISEFEESEIIFEQGDQGESFYIIKQGQVEVFKDDLSIRIINRHDFFGERAILFNEVRTATIKSKGAVCWVLEKNDFLSIIDKSMRRHIMKRIQLQDDKVTLQDLNLIKLLGQGMFGTVFLAHNFSKKISYALKVVHRSIVNQYDVGRNLALERKILMQIDHPFIVKLVKTFKDDSRVYFLMEVVQGMDLFDVIRDISTMTEEYSAFYIACLVLTLEHLHERNIIYRDLKPENIMIDEEGYTKLIDFGTSKLIKDRTYTVAGTAHYMAPEVISGTGYGLEADLWSLGIMLFEFIFNCVPFGEGEEDPYKVYNLVLTNELEILKTSKKLGCKIIIEKLLEKNPACRMNIETLKKNSWFLGMDWDLLLSKKIETPYIPKVHSFRKEIEKAAQNKTTVDNFIKEHESSTLKKSQSTKAKKDHDQSWDKEF